MATCPLCSERQAKRFCPAKETHICALCCGTKREIEIDCPSGCTYLKAARSYEADKRIPAPEALERAARFDDRFVYRYNTIFDAVTSIVIDERRTSQWLVDSDVIEVYKALGATLKTLSGGIYYESLPESPIRLSLFRRLRQLFDDLMNPQPETGYLVLQPAEAVQIFDFLTFVAETQSGIRPRSRKYLDWAATRFSAVEPSAPQSGLILP